MLKSTRKLDHFINVNNFASFFLKELAYSITSFLWEWLTPFYFLRNLRIDPIANKLMLHYARLEGLASQKHSSLLGSFVSYEGNEVLWRRLPESR